MDRPKGCQPATESPGAGGHAQRRRPGTPALQRAYERALDSEAEVSLRDAAALLRLQRQLDREADAHPLWLPYEDLIAAGETR